MSSSAGPSRKGDAHVSKFSDETGAVQYTGPGARFATVYDERFAHRYGYWRPVIAEVVEKYLSCGTPSTASPACAVVP